MRKSNRATSGWLGHILTFLATIIFLVGCVIIGYVAWILSTSVSIQKFQSGTLVLTYIVIGIGFNLFFTGLIGWVAGSAEAPCIIRLYIVIVVVSLTAGIGGLLALQLVRIELEDIFRYAWMESNQATRNLIQSSLNCCGFTGPREFATNNYQMDSSCYDMFKGEKRLKLASCSSELARWFADNKGTWVTTLVGVIFVEILSVVTAACSLHFLAKTKAKKSGRQSESRTSSNRHLYSEDSDNTSEAFRDSL